MIPRDAMDAVMHTSDDKDREAREVLASYHVDASDSRWYFINFAELWEYRVLLRFLVSRDLNARYKQTVIGMAWTVINPIITMLVFTFVFGNLANVATYDIPYPIFAFSGLVIWQFFSYGVSAGAISVVRESSLLRKVYFPRIIIPLSKIGFGIVDFSLNFIVLTVMMIIFTLTTDYQMVISLRLLYIVPLTLLTLVSALGISLWLSALHVRYRDIGHLVPFAMQMLMLLSPVAYPSELVSPGLRILYGLNPMVTVLDGYRWALLGIDSLHLGTVLISVISTTLLAISGVYFFNRLEQTFTDYL